MSKLIVNEKMITPTEASIILDGHDNYRSLSSGRVDAYSRAMQNKAWGLSVLIFDENGNLVDGQTRLTAVVRSGLSQNFVCLTGWAESEVCNIDGGQNRSRAQVAKADRGVKNANKVMAVVCGIETIVKKRSIINSESIELYDKYGQLAEELLACTYSCNSLCAALHVIPFARAIVATPERKDDIKASLVKMCDLDFSEARMSGLRLYYRLVVERGSGRGGKGRKDSYLRCSRAICAYLKNEEITKLFIPKTDPFASLDV